MSFEPPFLTILSPCDALGLHRRPQTSCYASMTAPLLNLPLQRLPWIAALVAFSLLPACETTPRTPDPDPRDTPLTAIDLEARPVSFQTQVSKNLNKIGIPILL